MSQIAALNLTKVRETTKAILFKNDKGVEAWIAKSQIALLNEIPGKPERYYLEIEEWKIKDKGLL